MREIIPIPIIKERETNEKNPIPNLDVSKVEYDFTPPRMLTIRQTARTGILTETAIRAGVREGWIPHIMTGNRCLVNYGKLCELLEAL